MKPEPMPKITVTVLDTKTGETKSEDWREDICDYSWVNGNWSCDCNRLLMFPGANTRIMETVGVMGVCLGCHQYLVVAVDPMPFGRCLDDFNDDYSDDLKRQAREWKPS